MPEGMACDGHGTLQTDGATQILVVTALSSHEFIYIGNLISFLWCVQLGIRIEISVEIHISRISNRKPDFVQSRSLYNIVYLKHISQKEILCSQIRLKNLRSSFFLDIQSTPDNSNLQGK